MDELTRTLNKLENYVAKYIYKKYIEIPDLPETTETTETTEITEILETTETPENKYIKYKYSKKPKNIEEYNKYRHTIFSQKRKTRINQDEILNKYLANIEIADEDYELNSTNFKVRNYESLPDILRCTFIRKHKNKYNRCCNKIINNEVEMCYKHEDDKNIYVDKWNELIKAKLGKTTTTNTKSTCV